MQVRNRFDVMIINPTEMTDDEEIILSYALEYQAALGRHYHNTDCLIPIPVYQIESKTDINLDRFSYIQLTHHILRRSRNSDASQHRYEVYGQMIGGGSFGKVYLSVGTLVTLEASRLMLKKNNPRVIKEMISDNNSIFEDIAKQEYEMTHRDEELGAKSPVFFKENITSMEIRSFMVMKYISGEELRKIIQRDQIHKKTQNNIDTDTRIKMSISLAIALERVHHNNIVHGDIKSANVIMNMLSPLKIAKVIDYGGSNDKQGHSKFSPVFTPLFAAPEVQYGNHPRQESDVYSSAWIFNEIWRGDYHPAHYMEEKLNERLHDKKNPVSFKKVVKKRNEIKKNVTYVSSHCKFINLFIGIDDLDKSHRQRIKDLLKRKSGKEYFDRGYFQELTEVFESISFERLIQKLPHVAKSDTVKYRAQELYINELKTAHSLGIYLRKQLDKFVIHDYSTINADDLIKIKNLFLDNSNGIHILSDKQEVIALFTERLRVTAFLGLKNKQAIQDKLLEIIDGYLFNMNTLVKIQSQVIELKKQMQDCMHLLAKSDIKFNSNEISFDTKRLEHEILILTTKKHQITLDKVASVNLKLIKHIDKLQTALNLDKDKLKSMHNGLQAMQEDMKVKEEELSKMSYLNFFYQATVKYVGQMGIFSNPQQPLDNKDKKVKHEVRITKKNYQ